MQQIFKFIEKYRYFLLFLFLEFFALFFTIQNHAYHKSKFINSANSITGSIYNKTSTINDFFYLKNENTRLVTENTHLKNLLSLRSIHLDSLFQEHIDTIKYYQKFKYTIAKITNNNFTRKNNFLTINKGSKQGVAPEMAVVNSNGIIGVTNSVSNNNSTVISILNSISRINVKLKSNNHFGTLSWDGKDYRTVQLLDLPRQAIIRIGDTITTGGKSVIFPKGILVGTVKDFETNNNSFQTINVSLFNDMSSLSSVNVIMNLEKEEIKQLEATNE
jgi:rod shape-determining protein MreC